LRQLEDDGIDLGFLLREEERALDRITRSDLSEIAGAASMIAMDGIDPVLMNLPNVPKGTRAVSERGIDIVAARISEGDSDTELGSDERLLICSVKHTVADGRDMYQKLLGSLNERALTRVYVTSQLRVLHGRLQERGLDADRIWLALRNFPDPRFVTLIGVAAADQPHSDEFASALSGLPEVQPGGHRITRLLIPGLMELPQDV
jgi:hypothetical protein